MTISKAAFYESYALDRALETDGAWVPVRNGARVKVRYENTSIVQERARQLDKKYRALMLAEGGLPADVQAERDVELIATAILVDWDGPTDAEGNGTFSVERARALLTDLPDFRRDVLYASRVSENFRAGEQVKITGNS